MLNEPANEPINLSSEPALKTAPDAREEAPLLPRSTVGPEWLRAGFFFALGTILLGVVAAIVWRLGIATLNVAAPFVTAIVLALLLDPLVDRLQRRGMARGLAVALVFGTFVLLLAGLSALIVPSLIAQANQLSQDGPKYVERVRDFVNEFLAGHRRVGTASLPKNFDDLFAQLSQRVSTVVSGSAGRVADLLLGSINAIVQTVVALIVAFYLLLDIDRLRARLFYLLPERARGIVGQLSGDIGDVFSNYLRGLLIVCALYGVFNTALFFGLGFAHAEMRHYALLVGAMAGVLYAVPYVGALVTALVTFLVGFAAGGASFGGIAVACVLVLNQIFDNVVTPRVIGGGVGLHPVIAIFALILGGDLFGLWGLLLSVPVAASIQVVLFRLFPKLNTETPRAFLRAQGVPPEKEESAKVMKGEQQIERDKAKEDKAASEN